jgi:hypothetical protein
VRLSEEEAEREEVEAKYLFVVRGRPSWLQVPRKSRRRLLGTGVLLSGGEGFEAGDGVRGCWVVVEREEGQRLRRIGGSGKSRKCLLEHFLPRVLEAGDAVRAWWVVEGEARQPRWMRSCSEVDGILEW